MKHKPEYDIIKTRYDVEREKIKEKLDATCPECHYSDIRNGMITDGEYDYYTCKKCGTEWKVLREDYKNRRSLMQKEDFLLIFIPTIFVIAIFVIALVITFWVSN